MAIDNDINSRRKVDLDQEEDRLVFPINVHESLKAASSLNKGEKTGLVLSLWIFGCAVLAWVLAGWLRQVVPQYYIWIVIAVIIALQLTVGVYVLRFAMDERSIFSEMNANKDSFATYFKIYKEIKSKEGSKYPFDLLEFDNGNYGVFIECRLGHNTQLRSEGTYYVNKSIVEILNKAGLPWKTFYHNESFKSSEAAQDLRDILKGIEDPELFTVYRDILQNYLDIAEDESNVVSVTYLIYATTRIAKDELLPVVNQIFTLLEKEDTVYRQVSCLKYDEIVEFLRHYYRLEVLDMGLIRAHIATKKNTFNCPVSVLKLYGRSGKSYSRDEFYKLNEEILATNGLDAVIPRSKKKH